MSARFKFFLRLAMLLCTAFATFAAPATMGAAPGIATPSMGAALIRMMGALVLVLTLFFAAAWMFRNGHKFKSARGAQRKLQVIEAKSLGPKQAIYVIGYEQQRLLIGATQQGLTLLSHLPEGQETPAENPLIQVSFGEALMQALGRK